MSILVLVPAALADPPTVPTADEAQDPCAQAAEDAADLAAILATLAAQEAVPLPPTVAERADAVAIKATTADDTAEDDQ